MLQASPEDEYFVDEFRRICPLDLGRQAQSQSQDMSSFDEVMERVVALAMTDAFPDPSYGLGTEELSDLRAKRYLDVVDGFYLATAVNPRLGVWRFTWQDSVFFSMRPDFVFKSLITDLGEAPINLLEVAVRKRLTDYYRHLDALKYALAEGELEAQGLYTVEFWTEFWKVRDLAAPEADGVSNAAPAQDRPLKTSERFTLLTIIAALCDYSDIKPKAHGTATQIAKMTQELGAPVSDDSVRRALARIDEAVESRKK
jgi:hypothetical protein